MIRSQWGELAEGMGAKAQVCCVQVCSGRVAGIGEGGVSCKVSSDSGGPLFLKFHSIFLSIDKNTVT